jgi:DNA processing protein
MNVNILTLSSHGYPENLAQITSPPEQLYWSGAKPASWLDRPKIGIVGSRKITPYGRTVTAKLAAELARAGVVVISGLAYGVDVCAHQAVLAANGLTVAVLGTSLDDIYPAAHAQIADQIARQGTIFSEYPAGTPGYPANFIARNRIISGLCDVLLITEAAVNSGSLHTARFALEQGKTVMAVPGNITSPISEGCNNLIKSGAVPVTSAEDVFFALGISPLTDKLRRFKGTAAERQVLDFIKEGLADQDELSSATKLDSPVLASTLTMLEIQGYIRPAGSGNWVIA